MQPTLVPGLTVTEHLTVDPARTIDFLGDGLRIYSTPSMVSDVEYATLRLIAAHLDPGESSLGVRIELDHLGATPLGEQVQVRLRVAAVDGRRVTVDAEVADALAVVGRGRHTRHVIAVERHAERLRAQRAAYPGAEPGP